jgi:hypothetical protein
MALLLALTGICFAASPVPAALPQAQVDVQLPKTSGATQHVRAGDSLQDALDRAQPGAVIELEAGAEFRGPFTLPRKNGDGWIVIRSSALSRLPAENNRVEPAHAASMPRLVVAEGPVLTTAPGAHHYRFIGVEIRPDAQTFLYNLVELGNGKETTVDLPHHIVFDRCYLHGDAKLGTRRGIALNGAHMAVVDSWLADFKEVGGDSQALAGWNGPGPFLIRNNHLEAAGENVMFGGATPAIANLVPADIDIRGNHFFKDLAWKEDGDAYAGTPWSVKNLFELKNARRVLVEGNLFEHNWAAAQTGFAVLLTVRNESGAAPWAVVEDVTFRNNLLTGIAGGFNILGHDENAHPSGQTSRLVISNNLFTDMGGKWSDRSLLQILDGVTDLSFEHNTALNTANILMAEGRPHTNVRFSHNVVRHNAYGMVGSGTQTGNQTLERYFPELELQGNVIVGGDAANYPGANLFPLSDADIDGTTHTSGVDMAALCAALAPPEHARHCQSGAEAQ